MPSLVLKWLGLLTVTIISLPLLTAMEDMVVFAAYPFCNIEPNPSYCKRAER